MSLNKYKPHILVLPEDDANRQIANGFLISFAQDPPLDVLGPAGGWRKAVDALGVHAVEMRKYPERILILVVDCDGNVDRPRTIKAKVPRDLKDRVFVLGVKSEPEYLCKDTHMHFEQIGRALFRDCEQDTVEVWGNDLLIHNQRELKRMLAVRSILFSQSPN